MITLLDQAVAARKAFRIPAGVVGEVWRDGRIQATLARFLKAPERHGYIRYYRCVGCDCRQRT
jgi:hypothetical protein